MTALLAKARTASEGRKPDGECYFHVATFLDAVGYGNIPAQPKPLPVPLPAIPDGYAAQAHLFADYVNEGDHAAALGLERLALDDPYAAPAGAIVVVRGGTPGTSDPHAGDISVAAGPGARVFYNGAEMSYGSAASFPLGNDLVLGIYVPRGYLTPTTSGAVPGAEGASCSADAECNDNKPQTGRVCGATSRVCIEGCHRPSDCPDGTACTRLDDGRQLCQ